MKTWLLLLVGIIPIIDFGQSGFGNYNPIATDLIYQISLIKVADIDGDSDIDVIMVDSNKDTIAWYENLDGQGSFGPINYITQTLNFTQYPSTSDLDSDGDLDILATSPQDGLLVWYENLDGHGSFSGLKLIANNLNNPKQAVAAPIDNLLGLDVVVAIRGAGKIVWYKNINGQGNFSEEQLVSNNTIGVYQLVASDIDNDNKTDIVCNSSSIGKPSWFKNTDGLGNFGAENIIDNLGTFKVITADVNGDFKLDLIKMESVNGLNSIHWLENIDGLGTFVQRQAISNYNTNSNIFATDIDNDGDIDLFATYVGDGKISWFENIDGLGTFGPRKVIDNFSSSTVAAADIDGDGYIDVISKRGNYNLVWYKNQTYLGVEDQPLQNLALYPNPTQDVLHLKNPNGIAVKQVQVYNMLGKKVLETAPVNNSIDVSALQSGLYMVKISTTNGVGYFKMVKK